MANWYVNEGPKYIVMFIWLGINAILFAEAYIRFDTYDNYVYLRLFIKEGLPVARGAAAVLNFNCLLILLPVCRNLLSFIRDRPSTPSFVSRLLDKNITFHKYIAYMICFATILHVGAHVFNLERLVSSYNDNDILKQRLNQLDDGPGQTRLNPIRDARSEPITELLKTVAGISGLVITVALIVMVASSTEFIRRSYYEVFWFTHHLFVVFFIGLVVHGLGGMIRGQTNTKQHNPKVCLNRTLAWSKPPCDITPQFSSAGAQTWKWVVAPMAIYLIERGIRLVRSFQTVEVKKLVKHPSKVLELQMRKSGFQAKAGQYIFLHCPSISRLEWHPFTLTSCPEEDFFSVHVRIVGDWTEALLKVCDTSATDVSKMPRLAVDGPFGTASTDVFHYPVVMCVGAGIGVTPFASVLKSVWYQHHKSNPHLRVSKVYFFWVCPDTNAFEWFADLLQSLEAQMHQKGHLDFLEYNIYLTRGWKDGDVRNIYLHESDAQDVITGLKQKTCFGRPNWNQIFGSVAAAHPNTDVGVFFCGPAVLSHTLHKMANKHSDSAKAVKFYYNKENF